MATDRFDDDSTRFNSEFDESTYFSADWSDSSENTTVPDGRNDESTKKAPGRGIGWKRPVAGVAAGLVIGGVATVLTSMKSSKTVTRHKPAEKDTEESKPAENENEQQPVDAEKPGEETLNENADSRDPVSENDDDIVIEHSRPASHDDAPHSPTTEPVASPHTASAPAAPYVDEHIQVSSTVNDDMSYSEAFSAARHEVGPGGVFEWHGTVYGTYTSAEWDNMSQADKNDFSSHFNWNRLDTSDSDLAEYVTEPDDLEVLEYDAAPGHYQEVSYDDEVSDDDGSIEVLGVAQSPDTGMYYGALNVDGQDVVLVDIDGDMEFDILVSDINGDGNITDNEVVDITGQGLCVDDLGDTHTAADDNSYNDDMSSDIYYDA